MEEPQSIEAFCLKFQIGVQLQKSAWLNSGLCDSFAPHQSLSSGSHKR